MNRKEESHNFPYANSYLVLVQWNSNLPQTYNTQTSNVTGLQEKYALSCIIQYVASKTFM